MRDDFDSVVADRFKVLDQVPVPDTWSRVRKYEEVPPMLTLDTPVPTEPRPKRPIRVVFAGILSAAAVVAIAFAATRDDDKPADESPIVTVPPAPPPALFGAEVESFASGTYFVDEVDGRPTPRIFVTLGDGWGTGGEWGISKDGVGFITFSEPDAVSVDACHHTTDGYHPGPLTTLDGLVAALSEQGGWVDVTEPSDVSVSGYDGQAFQRTSPAEFVDCDSSFAPFRGWEYQNESGQGEGWSYYSTDEVETLLVLDVDGTIIIISARTGADEPAAAQAAAEAELAAVIDSISIDPPPQPLLGAAVERFTPGTYFVDEVDGSPTPRIFITIGDGWSTEGAWGISNEAGYITFSKPDSVFLDACHSADGYHPGPLTTANGLVAALSEQRGWVDVTDPTPLLVNGYPGQAFQRTAPAEFVDCDTSFAPFRSWENEDENGNKGWSYYAEGEIETLWVLDVDPGLAVDDTIIIINTRTGSDQPAAAHAELVATRDTIRIDPG